MGTRPRLDAVSIASVLVIVGLASRRELWPILPALTALALAFSSRRPIASLFGGALFGVLLKADLDATVAAGVAWRLGTSVVWDWGHVRILVFTLCLGVVAEYTSRASAVRLFGMVSRGQVTALRVQLISWFMGLAVFVDDYVNAMLVGSANRTLFDRARVSREKLAFIVDATAAPVTSLVPVSTWIGVELGYLAEYYDSATGQSPLYVFVASIPYRFYPLLMLVFVLLTIVMAREFGPMRHAKALALGEESDPEARGSPGWLEAGLPLGAVLGVVFFSIYLDATGARASRSLDWGSAIAEADSLHALFLGAFVGVALAVALRVRRTTPSRLALLELAGGARTMVAPCLILLGAWTLGGSLRELGAGDVVALWVEEASAAEWVPALVFAAAAGASFVTGTSWGTMAILFPIAIPLVQGLPSVSEPQQLATVGAVLAGAVFGDHCSPISDTTIMSAAAAGCDPMAHVVTQLPYALVVGAVSLGATLWVGCAETAPVAVLGVALLVVALLLRLLGRPTHGRLQS